MAIKVISPGIFTSVQDLGRPGYYHLGIPLSGGMDRQALKIANLLVGNPEDQAVLEAVFMGPELMFTEDCTLAITGANLPPLLDGQPQPQWQAIEVQAGQTLSFDFLQAGARSYIAVAGGIDVPEVLGSKSTYTLGTLGGHQGRALQAGDVLPIGDGPTLAKLNQVPNEFKALPEGITTLRVVPGIYWHRLTEQSQHQFFQDIWTVAAEADRIGYRFRGGTPMQFVERDPPFGAGADPSNIVDSGYPYGSIQVPGGKEPIVLHRDAVSGGGYCMIGTVISADLDKIGQLQPNTKVQFSAVTLEQALAARQQSRARYQQLACGDLGA